MGTINVSATVLCGPGRCSVLTGLDCCGTCKGTGSVSEEMPRWQEEGRRIKRIREYHDLSQRELAGRLGVKPIEVNEAEHGRIDPTSVLEKARALR
jgi:DNA-binding XRE family transcriptional regulator